MWLLMVTCACEKTTFAVVYAQVILRSRSVYMRLTRSSWIEADMAEERMYREDDDAFT